MACSSLIRINTVLCYLCIDFHIRHSRVVYQFVSLFLIFTSRMELDRFQSVIPKLKGKRNSLDKEIHNLRLAELVRVHNVLFRVTIEYYFSICDWNWTCNWNMSAVKYVTLYIIWIFLVETELFYQLHPASYAGNKHQL